jgi:hypothetical protein
MQIDWQYLLSMDTMQCIAVCTQMHLPADRADLLSDKDDGLQHSVAQQPGCTSLPACMKCFIVCIRLVQTLQICLTDLQ